ncbi:erbin isoform X1 [Protopterus annectens]|uniref:erbin isoform X1 n=1 Tax=Protopterus annectens TaxID=7888 RepID=UPI001CF9B053|nr:erbin isoform X1 [Protopterus annectens]
MTTKRNIFVRLVPCRCLRGEEEVIRTIDFSHCNLEQVPKEIFSHEKTLEELYLDANQIDDLPKQLFNCQSLHKLSLPDNELSALPPSIANLINLRELDISKNGIQEFPENIKNCKVLTVVEASVNPINKLPDGFTQLLNLTQLYLNDAFLDFLPANFGRLTKLQILELRENQLKMLPKTMNKLTLLERLDLGSNEFSEVPEVIEQLTGLKEFWIDTNRLTILPGFLGKLKNLTYLDASKNNLDVVEDGISGCDELQDLVLSSNALQHLPESIGSLKKLTTLKIDENQLMYLPESIGGLASLEELDCCFNEIEALPISIGQFAKLRTLAADHNFLTQLPPEIGNLKCLTVLFLHSNKLELLPEEMGDMESIKVINLSDNRLKYLPFSFTKLQQLTALWLSDNQSKPLIPLQKEVDNETQKTVLTNYMFPQQPRTEDGLFISDNESFNPALWEEMRKQRAQVAFECDEDKDEREAPPREGHLKRNPTPYPDELKNMVKTAQTIAQRLESTEAASKEAKIKEAQHVSVKSTGVKTSENLAGDNSNIEIDGIMMKNCAQEHSNPEIKENPERLQFVVQDISYKNTNDVVNHEETLEDSDISSDEEMKIAEMRPPLIEISVNQPKVVALSKDKKDESKDVDSLLDDTVPNSNQNNSNCSSPSRMSDSVSLNTESSQDISLCSPERESKFSLISRTRQEDENSNKIKVAVPVLSNGSNPSSYLPDTGKNQREVRKTKELITPGDFDIIIEEKLAFVEKGITLSAAEEAFRLDQINMNISNRLNEDYIGQLSTLENSKNVMQAIMSGKALLNTAKQAEHLEIENRYQRSVTANHLNGSFEETSPSPKKAEMGEVGTDNVVLSTDVAISRSTEELSPKRACPLGPVVKSHSISNIETGGLKLYDIVTGDGLQQNAVPRAQTANVHSPHIVRSKSASLLTDQPLQVFPASSSSSDLLTCTVTTTKFDSNYKCEGASARGSTTGNSQMPVVPQYNIQYSSTSTKDGLWPQRTVPAEHGNLPTQHLQRIDAFDGSNCMKHPANLNFSNHNNVRATMAYNMQQRMAPRQIDMWAAPPNDRFARNNTLQRQNSGSSNGSVTVSESAQPRRIAVPEGDYMTYRDLHHMGRGEQLAQGMQRPISARTYSTDGPAVSRAQIARPPVNEVPERTMSVSDFNYSRTSPTKKANIRVKSEHSLLEPQGMSRVPHDWREQVLRHIEAKKLEKGGSIGEPYQDEVFSSGQQSYSATALNLKEAQSDTMTKVPLTNGQMGQPSWSQSNYFQAHHPVPQATVARHPSREQLIDYLMLKVAQQPTYSQTLGPPRQGHEIRVRIEKNPELGFSISGGIGGRGNPFKPDDNGIFVTRVQLEGPASKLLQPGDKIIQANGYSFINIDHTQAVSLLKTFQNTVDLVILREVPV